MKYNIALQGFIFSSGRFCVCYSIIVLFMYKVLLYERLKPFTVMLLLWCSVQEITRLLGGVVVVVVCRVVWCG